LLFDRRSTRAERRPSSRSASLNGLVRKRNRPRAHGRVSCPLVRERRHEHDSGYVAPRPHAAAGAPARSCPARGRRAPGAGATATSNSSSTTTFFLCFDRGGYAISATASSDLNYIDLRNSQRYLTSVMLMPVQNSPGVTMTLPSDVRICEFSIASLLGWLWNERDSESCCEDRPRYRSHHR